MNQERAREIAREVQRIWLQDERDVRCCVDAVADALHAAYEAERAEPVTMEALRVAAQSASEAISAARLSSVKETARAIWAAYFVSGDTPMAQWYSGGKDVERIKADTNAVVNLADELESAFERRYGGKP